jgi:hypothetical protein
MKYVQLAVFIGSMSGLSHAMNNHEAAMMNDILRQAIERAMKETKVPELMAMNMLQQDLEKKYGPSIQMSEQQEQHNRIQAALFKQRQQTELIGSIEKNIGVLEQFLIKRSGIMLELEDAGIEKNEGFWLEVGEYFLALQLVSKVAEHEYREDLKNYSAQRNEELRKYLVQFTPPTEPTSDTLDKQR